MENFAWLVLSSGVDTSRRAIDSGSHLHFQTN